MTRSPGDRSSPDLSIAEHALALVVAFTIARFGGVLAGNVLTGLWFTTPDSAIALLFTDFRHASIGAAALLLAGLFAHRPRLLIPAALAIALSMQPLEDLSAWLMSHALVFPGLSRRFGSLTFEEILLTSDISYDSVIFYLPRCATALGLILAVRQRGRAFEGLAFIGATTLVSIAILLHLLSFGVASFTPMYLCHAAVEGLLVALGVPIAERVTMRVFRALGIRDADPGAGGSDGLLPTDTDNR
jgi:hypothetical protein